MFMIQTKYTVVWTDPAGESHQLACFGEEDLRHLLKIVTWNSFTAITVLNRGDGSVADIVQTTDDHKLDLHQGV